MINKIILNKVNSIFTNKRFLLYLLYIVGIMFLMYFVWLRFQYLLTSWYFLFNKSSTSKDIIIVALDKKTLSSESFKRFQDINRSDYAELVRNISYWQPKVIWLDVLFLHDSDNEANDREFKKEVEDNENIVLASEIWSWWLIWWLFMGQDYKWYGYVDIISYNDMDIYNFNLNDYKNKIPIAFEWQNPPLSFAMNVFKKAYWYNDVNVNFEKSIVSFDNWKYKVPLQHDWSNYNMNVNFFSDTYQTVSFIDVLKKNIDLSVFKDKIVLVWATASDIHDEFITPYDTSNFMPWVVSHANTINMLMTWKFISYQWFWSFIFLNFLLLVVFVTLIFFSQRILFWIATSVWVLFLYIICAILLFTLFGYFIELSPLIFWFWVLNSIIFFDKFFEELKNKNQIKNMFSKYVSKDVVDEMMKVGLDSLSLWGTDRVVTVFFSDLVWFTQLSESLTTEQLWRILNIYFESMSNIILTNHWTIDKFMWDAIMAFWNAPLDVNNHENLACETALLQRQSLQLIKDEIAKFWVNVNIDMRIWINTWPAVVWNFGCSKRYDYTVLWDSVNLASRLESINKQYETKIMISEYTYNNIDKDKFVIREVDLITVKWKEHPVRIYELVWFVWQVDELVINKISLFHEWLSLYRQRSFQNALLIFQQIDDPVAQIFVARCKEFIQAPPEDKWDNVFRFKVK